MKTGLFLFAVLWCLAGNGQGIRIVVKQHDTADPIIHASVKLTAPGVVLQAVTDSSGIATFPADAGLAFYVEVTHVGFEAFRGSVRSIAGRWVDLKVELEEEHEEEEEVVIQSTRSSRTISDIPTRVEFIAGEELDEKSNMKPGDIRMVLNESTGIQTQQTSATSANAAIRIQGLDGRYTQVLKDGFPNYAGMSSGLGLLQTPPLDLQQIEVIKGSASTLYGGGAIAGLVNLISKKPAEERELKFHVDLTSAGGVNTSGFYGQRFNKAGVTFFATRNSNATYDPAGIGLTAIPKFSRYNVTPRLFYQFSPKTDLQIGAGYTNESRIGGDVGYIKGNNPNGFFENNISERLQAQMKLEHLFGDHSHLVFRSSFSFFERTLRERNYRFMGTQHSTFSEITYASHGEQSEWIIGVNVLTDVFSEMRTSVPLRNYRQLSGGAFVQNNWRASSLFILESGLRAEYVKDYGFVILPRLSALFKFSPKLTSRVGGGLGYKTPNVFTEESERLQYRNVLPINADVNELEKSYGVNADLNYRTRLGEVDFSINHMFFYTRIQDPLLLRPDGVNYRFVNIPGHFDSRGMETNMKLGFHDFKLFLGYTLTDAYLHEGSVETPNVLTPKHRLNSVLLYEVHEKLKLGLEGYYFSRQLLNNGSYGRPYWVMGFMAEKIWEKISMYINFENFLDARQTRYGPIYDGSISSPVFRDIYAPLDGFVVNGGVKVRF